MMIVACSLKKIRDGEEKEKKLRIDVGIEV